MARLPNGGYVVGTGRIGVVQIQILKAVLPYFFGLSIVGVGLLQNEVLQVRSTITDVDATSKTHSTMP
jgi:hypothetical protein